VLFGPDHLWALTLSAIIAAAAIALARRHRGRPGGQVIRIGLALFLVAGAGSYAVAELLLGRLSVWDLAPLHLCDFAIFVAALALLSRHQRACELLYFWAGSGTLLAMVTPDLWLGLPDWRFVVYFAMHGGVLVAALTVTFGFGNHPRPGSALQAFLLTLFYAGIVAVVDWGFGKNYLFLRAKPPSRTLLDAFGPWPVYLVVAGAIGLALFLLLELPFRLCRHRPDVC
jgi:hypothetical integral membrane protein (TIGR02206 family)